MRLEQFKAGLREQGARIQRPQSPEPVGIADREPIQGTGQQAEARSRRDRGREHPQAPARAEHPPRFAEHPLTVTS